MKYNLGLLSAPQAEPLTLGEAKDHCRIEPEITEDDNLIEGLIVAARQLAEARTNCKMITQTWVVTFDAFDSPMEIPLSPMQAVESINYYDAGGTLIMLDPILYQVNLRAKPRALVAPIGSWPASGARMEAVQIQVRAGFGDAPGDVPESLRRWMLVAVSDGYDHRNLTSEGGNLTVSPFLDSLLDPFRITEI